MITSEEKKKAVSAVQRHKDDSGSPESQIAILTSRISQLTSHLKTHKLDHHSRRGLLQMVGQRKRLLSYLKRTNQNTYDKLIKELGLRG